MRRRAKLKLECLEERVLLNGRTDFVVNTTLAGDQFNPAVAVDGKGNYIVAWEGPNPATGSEGVFAQRFLANGTPNGGEIVVDSTFSGAQRTPSIAADAAGDFVIVWVAPGPGVATDAIWGEVYNAGGQAVTTDTFLDTFTAGLDSQPRVAMNAAGTSIVVTYTGTATGNQDIYGQMFDGFLGTVGNTFTVNTTGTFNQSASALAMDSAGNFTVTWLSSGSGSGNSIVARRFDAQGNPLTGELTVASSNVTNNGDVAVAPDGGFLAVWDGTDQTTHNSEVMALRFNASNQAGTSFIVSNPTTASVAGSAGFDSAGNSVIAWQVQSTSSPVSDTIEAQRYDSAGHTVGQVQTLSASPASNLSPVALAVASDGTYLDAWAAPSTAGDLDVHATLVPPANPPPVITSLTGTLTGNEGGTFSYHVAASDSDGDPLTYGWDLNGTGVFGGPNSPDASAVFTQVGTHQVAVLVSDGQNASVEAFVTVTVNNVAATVNAGPSQTINEGATATLQGSSTDPGSANETYTYEWDFNYNGQTFNSQATGATIQHQFSKVGTYTVALRVTDSNGGATIGTTTVTVKNVAPTVNAGPPQTINEGATATFQGSSTDPGASNETYIYEWDFNYNGQTFNSQATGANAQHQFLQPGTFTVALRVTDSNGGVSIGTTTVTVINVAPTANAGPAQTISAGASASFHGTATDPGLPVDLLTYAWDFTYNGTTFQSQATGQNVSHVYTSAGTFRVALQVTDSSGATSLSVTTVTVQGTQVDPNLVFQSITTPFGDSRVYLNYRIAAPAALTSPVQVGLYATLTGVIDSTAVLLGTTTISTTALDSAGQLALAPGSHTVITTTAALGFPVDPWGSRLWDENYFLAARLDNAHAIPATNRASEDVLYRGVYQVPGSDTLFIQSVDPHDLVTVASMHHTLTVTFDGTVFQYPSRAVDLVEARIHGANSELNAANADVWVRAFAGGANDWLVGGEEENLLFAAGHDDNLVANGVLDLLFANGDDDRLMPGHGLNLLGAGGNQDVYWHDGQWVPLQRQCWQIV
jgi:PKD repeat protein